MKVTIETIPHNTQRYDTVGDWWWEGEDLHIRVSEMGDWKAEMAVAYHELFEVLACKAKGITQDAVDKFDMAWKEHDNIEEPGDDTEAPYHHQHVTAGIAERLLAQSIGLNWDSYADTVMNLE